MTRNPLVLHADRGSVVAKKAALAFDPKVFLAVVGSGKTISHYRKGEAIFAQGDPGDAVFFIEIRTGQSYGCFPARQGSDYCVPRTWGLHRRGMPGQSDASYLDGFGHDRMCDYPGGEIHNDENTP
jgi:hypothetical protein